MERRGVEPRHGSAALQFGPRGFAVCFYLTLPALYLVLGGLALTGPRRLLVLALVLACPVYIFTRGRS